MAVVASIDSAVAYAQDGAVAARMRPSRHYNNQLLLVNIVVVESNCCCCYYLQNTDQILYQDNTDTDCSVPLVDTAAARVAASPYG